MWYHNKQHSSVSYHKTTQLCQLPTKHNSVSYPQNNTALLVTHKTQLCQLPTKQHSSVSYPQNTALSVTHKTTRLPTKLSHGTWTGTTVLTSLRASCASARKDSSTPMMVIRINTMSTSVTENTHCYLASTQCLHLLEKKHINTKSTSVKKQQHKNALSSSINTMSTSVQKNNNTLSSNINTMSTAVKKMSLFLSCNICHKIPYF